MKLDVIARLQLLSRSITRSIERVAPRMIEIDCKPEDLAAPLHLLRQKIVHIHERTYMLVSLQHTHYEHPDGRVMCPECWSIDADEDWQPRVQHLAEERCCVCSVDIPLSHV